MINGSQTALLYCCPIENSKHEVQNTSKSGRNSQQTSNAMSGNDEQYIKHNAAEAKVFQRFASGCLQRLIGSRTLVKRWRWRCLHDIQTVDCLPCDGCQCQGIPAHGPCQNGPSNKTHLLEWSIKYSRLTWLLCPWQPIFERFTTSLTLVWTLSLTIWKNCWSEDGKYELPCHQPGEVISESVQRLRSSTWSRIFFSYHLGGHCLR